MKTRHLTPELFEREIQKMLNVPDRIFITHCKPAYKKTIRKELQRLDIQDLKLFQDGDVCEF